MLTAEIPNDELGGVEVGSSVSVDLRRAKAFPSAAVEDVEPATAMTATPATP